MKCIMCRRCNLVMLSTTGTRCQKCGNGTLVLGDTFEDAQRTLRDARAFGVQSERERLKFNRSARTAGVKRCKRCKKLKADDLPSTERGRGVLAAAHPARLPQPGVEVCLCVDQADRLKFNRSEVERVFSPRGQTRRGR